MVAVVGGQECAGSNREGMRGSRWKRRESRTRTASGTSIACNSWFLEESRHRCLVGVGGGPRQMRHAGGDNDGHVEASSGSNVARINENAVPNGLKVAMQGGHPLLRNNNLFFAAVHRPCLHRLQHRAEVDSKLVALHNASGRLQELRCVVRRNECRQVGRGQILQAVGEAPSPSPSFAPCWTFRSTVAKINRPTSGEASFNLLTNGALRHLLEVGVRRFGAPVVLATRSHYGGAGAGPAHTRGVASRRPSKPSAHPQSVAPRQLAPRSRSPRRFRRRGKHLAARSRARALLQPVSPIEGAEDSQRQSGYALDGGQAGVNLAYRLAARSAARPQRVKRHQRRCRSG